MSTNIDKRVVEMQFDNRQFEQGVQTTRKSLQDLKESLNFEKHAKSFDALDRAANNVDLSGIASGVEALQKRFSTLGIVGFTAIQKLTNSALSFGKRLSNSTFGQIVSGGKQRALNLEQAQFQIKGLGVDWKKAAKNGVSLYDQIDKAVSGTAYGLDAAAKVSGQLLASNIKAGSKDMQNALSGISGVAAMTNSSYEEIGHIFTTIAGNGRLMGEQLMQFSTRGLNVASELAKKYKVSEKELREMVSKGEVDFKTFAEAMNDAFGKQATKANDTYTGALSNVRSALSRIGEQFFTPYQENMRRTFVAMIPVLNSVKTSLLPLFEVGANGMKFFRKEAVKVLKSLAIMDKDGKTVAKGMKNVEKSVQSFVKKLNKKDLEGNTVFDYLKKSYKSVKGIFRSIGRIASSVITPVKAAIKSFFPLKKSFKNIQVTLKGIEKFVKRFSKTISKSVSDNNGLGRILKGIAAAFSILVNVGKVAAGVFGKIAIIFAKLFGVVIKLLAPVGDLISAIRLNFIQLKAFSKIFKPFVDSLGKLKRSLKAIGSAFKDAFKKAFAPFTRQLGTSSGVILSIIDVLEKFFTFVANKITPAILFFSKILKNNADNIRKFGNALGSVFEKILTNKTVASVSDRIKKTRDSIAKTISSFASMNMDGIKKFSEKFKKVSSPFDAIKKFVSGIFGLFKSIVSKIGPIVGSAIKLLFNGLTSIINIVKNGIDSLKNTSASSLLAGGGVVFLITKFVNNIGKVFDRLDELDANSFIGKIKGIFGSLTDYVESLKKAKMAEQLKTFATSVLEVAVAVLILSSIDSERLVAATGAVSALIWELAKVFKMMDSGSDSLKLWEKKDISSIGSVLMQMATSVLILALALKTLDGMNPEQLILGFVAISSLLQGMVKIVQKLSNEEKKVAKGASILISMAVAIRIMTKSVRKLGEMNPEQLANGLLGVLTIMTALTYITSYLSTNSEKACLNAAEAILVIAVSMRIFVAAIKRFSSIDWETLAKAGITLGAVIGAIFLLNKIGGENPNAINKLALSLFIMSKALIALAIGLIAFRLVDWAGLAKAGTAMLGLFVSFEMLKEFKASEMLKIAGALSAMGGAMASLAVSLIIFRLVDWAGLAKAGVTLLGLYVAFEMFKEIKASDFLKTAGALAAIGGALVPLAVGLALFKFISWDTLVKGFITIGVALGALVLITKKMGESIDNVIKLAGAFALFGLGVTLLGVGVLALSAGLAGLSASVAVFFKSLQIALMSVLELIPLIFKVIGAAIIAFLDVIRDSAPAFGAALKAVALAALDAILQIAPKLGETIAELLRVFIPILVAYIPKIVDALVTILIGVINALAERIPELILAIANFVKKLVGAIEEVANAELTEDSIKGIILGFTAIAACMLIIAGAAKMAQKAIVGVIAILAVMAMMTTMFLLISTIDPNAFIIFSLGLSAAIISISGSMLLISMLPVAAAINGIIGLGIMVAGLVAILEILGGLSQIPGFTWLLEEGSKTLAIVGKAIGDFVGNIIGGVLGGIMSALPGIADSLSDFMVRLQPFLLGAKFIDSKALDGVLQLVGVILALTATELINSVVGFLTGGADFTKLGEQLCSFAPYLASFALIVSSVSPKAILVAAIAASAVAKLINAMPKSGGLAGALFGENDIGKWGPQLVKFGKSLVKFNEAVKGKVNLKAVQTAAKAGKAIASMADKVPNEGGVVGFFTGENSLAKFGLQISVFGASIATFSKAVKGNIDLKAVKTAAKAGKALASMADKVPNQGGVAGFFMGDNSLAAFGPEITSFAWDLAEFSTAVVGNINLKAIQNAANAGKALAEMTSAVPESGGFFSVFTGDNNLSDFGETIKDFINSLGSDDIDENKVKKAATSVETIAGSFSKMGQYRPETVTAFANSLKTLGESGIDNFVASFENAGLNASNAAKVFLENVVSGMKTQKDPTIVALRGISNSISGSVLNTLKGRSNEFVKQGKDLMKRFGIGVNNSKTDTVTIFVGIINEALKKIREKRGEFYSSGEYLVGGLTKGVKDTKYKAIDASEKVATGMIKATNKTLKEHSPSREGYGSGKNYILGIVNGMIDYSRVANDVAEKNGKSILNTTSDILSSLAGVDFNSLEINPRIRPVLDLSNLNNGVSGISNLFNGTRSYSISASVANERAKLIGENSITIETTSGDVVNAVEKLGRKVDGLSKDMRNMKVVMDTGATVGALAPGIDNSLGRTASYKERGI